MASYTSKLQRDAAERIIEEYGVTQALAIAAQYEQGHRMNEGTGAGPWSHVYSKRMAMAIRERVAALNV